MRFLFFLTRSTDSKNATRRRKRRNAMPLEVGLSPHRVFDCFPPPFSPAFHVSFCHCYYFSTRFCLTSKPNLLQFQRVELLKGKRIDCEWFVVVMRLLVSRHSL